jgi:hypothetical protein
MLFVIVAANEEEVDSDEEEELASVDSSICLVTYYSV